MAQATGMHDHEFQVLVMKHQEVPNIQMALQACQIKQAEVLSELGLEWLLMG